MNKTCISALLFCACALAACGKKNADKEPTQTAAAPVATAPVLVPSPPAADPAPEQRERALKQAQLDYAITEDGYLKEPRGQWAQAATATSTFGDEGGQAPSDGNAAANLAGAPDGKMWTNNHQDIGFDSVELAYAKPVSASEVRVVCKGSESVESLNKIELQGVDGSWKTVWSGLSEAKQDSRGSRTWFVKSFTKTAYQVKAVRVSFANNVKRGYKVVDAVQLVGD